ncbi:hypothetical protein MAR_035610 [Mya arenaria]|uniref:Uncharacterized protein n=1 Tax=Mya arenaria TaxID=6604 RepID=A0ABY7EQ41_MYAAR|nr:hypothetical protein MAR_035610 [Mya arenaria]
MTVNHPEHVITNFTADLFIPDLVCFHCPTVTLIKINEPKLSSFKRKIRRNDQADFDSFRNELVNVDWSKITNTLKTFTSKVVTIRPNDIPWFTPYLRKFIRKRKREIRKTHLDFENKIIQRINSENIIIKETSFLP